MREYNLRIQKQEQASKEELALLQASRTANRTIDAGPYRILKSLPYCVSAFQKGTYIRSTTTKHDVAGLCSSKLGVKLCDCIQ